MYGGVLCREAMPRHISQPMNDSRMAADASYEISWRSLSFAHDRPLDLDLDLDLDFVWPEHATHCASVFSSLHNHQTQRDEAR
jgi:hypothetical protein